MCYQVLAKRFLKQGYPCLPLHGKEPKIPNWQTIPIDESMIDHWITIGHHNANLGVRHQPALDGDIYDEGVATLTLNKIREKVGAGVTVRYGQRPKFLVPIKCDHKRKLISASFSKPGSTDVSRIEFLTQGQQWVVAGMHPTTKEPYTWETDEGAVPFFKTTPDTLPGFTLADVEDIFTFFEETCRGLGWVETKPRPGQSRSVVLTDEQLEQATRAQPTKLSPIDDFNRNGITAFKEKIEEVDWRYTGTTGSFMMTLEDGTKINVPAERWTRPGKADGTSASIYKSPLTGVWYMRMFSSSIDQFDESTYYISHVFTVMFCDNDYTRSTKAFRKLGFRGDETSPEEDFADLNSDDLMGAFLKRFIFCMDGPCVIDTTLPPDRAVMKLAEFKPAYQNIKAAAGKKKAVADAWLNHPARVMVRGVCYKPGEERVFMDERGMAHFNRFCMPEWLYTENTANIGPVYEHLKYLLGDGLDFYLGWMSHVVSKPGDRPMVTPLLISAHHGTGRGWVDELMKKLLGVWNCAATTIDVLAGLGNEASYQEYMHETIYCSIPEAKGSTKARYEINDAIRDKLTTNHSQLNLKYGAKQFSAVHTAFHMASNHRLVFSLDPVDRRIYVKECLLPPKTPEYYDRLYAWLENPEHLRQWYWWLRRYNATSDWNAKAPAPMTREKATMCNVDSDRPEAASIVALMLDESLPAVCSFAQAQVASISVMKRLLPPEDHYKALIPREQLKAILSDRCIHALQGGKCKIGHGKYGRVYILRDNVRWVNASQEEITIELAKWDTFDLSVLEFTNPVALMEG